MCDGDWLGKPQPCVSLTSYAVVKNCDVKHVWRGRRPGRRLPLSLVLHPVMAAVCCLADAFTVLEVGRKPLHTMNRWVPSGLASVSKPLGFPSPPRRLRCLAWE